GNTAFTNPANAYDGNAATFANAAVVADTIDTADVLWKTWTSPTFTYENLTLRITSQVLLSNNSFPDMSATLEYSTDSGSTFKTVYQIFTARVQQTDEIVLQAGMDLSKLRVRATIANLSVDGGPADILTLRVYEIDTLGTLDTVGTLALVNKQADVCVVSPADAQETAVRLYRRGGTLPNNWNRVGHFPTSTLVQGGCSAGSLEIVDNIADVDLGSTIELDNDVPITSVETTAQPLPLIWGPFDERVLGCGDPNRPESVYFSKRGDAGAWPPQNHIEVSSPGDPMQNGVVYNARTFVFSRERMYELVPNIQTGVTFTPFPTPCGRGIIAPFGLTVSDAIYFVAKDGVFMTTGGPERSLVDNDIQPLFPTQSGPGRDVNGYEAIDFTSLDDIELEWHNDELYFTYKGATSGNRQTLIYDLIRRRWRAATWTPEIVTAHSEVSTVSSLLVGSSTGILYNASGNDDSGTAITASLRTGSHDQGQPLNT
ncbi:hypothetical protein LCGC14_2539580, partial [marine sediment metagenome]